MPYFGSISVRDAEPRGLGFVDPSAVTSDGVHAVFMVVWVLAGWWAQLYSWHNITSAGCIPKPTRRSLVLRVDTILAGAVPCPVPIEMREEPIMPGKWQIIG